MKLQAVLFMAWCFLGSMQFAHTRNLLQELLEDKVRSYVQDMLQSGDEIGHGNKEVEPVMEPLTTLDPTHPPTTTPVEDKGMSPPSPASRLSPYYRELYQYAFYHGAPDPTHPPTTTPEDQTWSKMSYPCTEIHSDMALEVPSFEACKEKCVAESGFECESVHYFPPYLCHLSTTRSTSNANEGDCHMFAQRIHEDKDMSPPSPAS